MLNFTIFTWDGYANKTYPFENIDTFNCEDIPTDPLQFNFHLDPTTRTNIIEKGEYIYFTINQLRKSLPPGTLTISQCPLGFTCSIQEPLYFSKQYKLQFDRVNPPPAGMAGFTNFTIKVPSRNQTYLFEVGSLLDPSTQPVSITSYSFYPTTVTLPRFSLIRGEHWTIEGMMTILNKPSMTWVYGNLWQYDYQYKFWPQYGNKSQGVYRVLIANKEFNHEAFLHISMNDFYGNKVNVRNDSGTSLSYSGKQVKFSLQGFNGNYLTTDIPNDQYVFLEITNPNVNLTGYIPHIVLDVNKIGSPSRINCKYPLSFLEGYVNQYKFGTVVVLSKQTSIDVTGNITINEEQVKQFQIPKYNETGDNQFSFLENIKYFKINETHYMVRIHASDPIAGIFKIDVNGNILNTSDLVTGTLNSGVFEKIINFVPIQEKSYFNPTISITNYNMKRVENIYYYKNKLKEPIPMNPLIQYFIENPFSISNITSFQFSQNDILLQDGIDVNVTLTFAIVTPIRDWIPKLKIKYPFSEYPNCEFTGKLDTVSNSYKIQFTLISRLFDGVVDYELDLSAFKFTSNEIISVVGDSAQIRVSSNNADQMAPLVNTISVVPQATVTVGATPVEFGWDMTIVDNLNGFSYGELEIKSEKDPLPTKIRITMEDATVGSTLFSSTYQIRLTAEPTCVTQTFYLSRVMLVDKYGYKSLIDMHEKTGGYMNPMSKSLSPQILVQCPPVTDVVSPKLISFQFDPKHIDTSAPSDLLRTVTFNLVVTDTDSPISQRHLPTVYLTYNHVSLISEPSNITSVENDGKTIRYTCQIVVPYGVTNPLPISIYGISDINLNFNGYLPSDLRTDYGYYFVGVNFRFKPYISYTSTFYSSSGGSLTIFGRNLGLNDPAGSRIDIDYGSGFSYIGKTFEGGVMVITENIAPRTEPFKVRVFSEIQFSNVVTVIPSSDSPPIPVPTPTPPTPTPSPSQTPLPTPTPTTTLPPTTTETSTTSTTSSTTSTTSSTTESSTTSTTSTTTSTTSSTTSSTTGPSPSPTPTPTKPTNCIGDPICGGPLQGNCIDDRCVCIPPWTDIDCGSMIINNTKPNANQTSPGTNTDYEGELPNGEIIKFSTLVQIESIREIGANNQVIKDIENIVLDEQTSTDNPEESSTRIGVTIPPFKSLAILDPDFSVLLIPKKSTSGTCTGSKGLTKPQLAGIIIASVCGAAAIGTITTYFIYRKRRENMFNTKMETKLRSIN
eukprot:gene6744-8362_t